MPPTWLFKDTDKKPASSTHRRRLGVPQWNAGSGFASLQAVLHEAGVIPSP
jgi:hypothetical protein